MALHARLSNDEVQPVALTQFTANDALAPADQLWKQTLKTHEDGAVSLNKPRSYDEVINVVAKNAASQLNDESLTGVIESKLLSDEGLKNKLAPLVKDAEAHYTRSASNISPSMQEALYDRTEALNTQIKIENVLQGHMAQLDLRNRQAAPSPETTQAASVETDTRNAAVSI